MERFSFEDLKQWIAVAKKDNRLDVEFEVMFDTFPKLKSVKLTRNKKLAETLITELEDRRFLFEEPEFEHIRATLLSTQEMRDYLKIEVLKKTDRDSVLHQAAALMQQACHKYLQVEKLLTKSDDGFFDFTDENHHHIAQALSQLRQQFGLALVRIVLHHRIDNVKPHLGRIMPTTPMYDSRLVKLKSV